MQAARGACQAAQLVPAEPLESELGAYFAALALPADWRARALSLFSDNADAAKNETLRRSLTNELTRARKLYIAGDLSDDEYRAEKQRIETQLDAVQPVVMPDLDKAAALLANIGAVWSAASDAEKTNLARALLEKVWVKQNKIVALEPRATFYPLFEILELPKETPPDALQQDGESGMLWRERRASIPPTRSRADFGILILRHGMAPR